MTYAVLKLVHVLGAIVIGAGLIGVWLSDMRSRQVRHLPQFSEAVRSIAVFEFIEGNTVTRRYFMRLQGTLKPATWTVFIVGVVIVVGVAMALTILVPRLYPSSPGPGEC